MAEPTPSILDIIDRAVAEKTAKRDDAVGWMVKCVLAAADPDAVMLDLSKSILTGYLSTTRKQKVTMLATAFGAVRDDLKAYLRAHSVCGPAD